MNRHGHTSLYEQFSSEHILMDLNSPKSTWLTALKSVIFQQSSALLQFYQSGQHYLCILSWRRGEPLSDIQHLK